MDRVEIGPSSLSRLTYDEAWVYCLTLSHNGHKDWTMPSMGLWLNSSKIQGWSRGHNKNGMSTNTETKCVTPVRAK